MNVARFLLRDGNKVGAEVSPEGARVFTYTDQKGQQVHALTTVKAEEFLKQGALEASASLCTHGESSCQGGWTELSPKWTQPLSLN